jgi:hypothetical protein
MSILNKLTEGIQSRDLQKEGDALLSKWEKTGLLEGLEGDVNRNGMARLLENQAAQLLKEASSMAAGDVEGFASVAFPLVRRVFGGLLANDLVSVQPMSLPSGLIFFLDFTFNDQDRISLGSEDAVVAKSVYGGGRVAAQITGGVNDITEEGGGLYNLNTGYSSPTGTVEVAMEAGSTIANPKLVSALTEAEKKALRFDPDLLSNTTFGVVEKSVALSSFTNLNTDNLIAISASADSGSACSLIRRLTKLDSDGTNVLFFFQDSGGDTASAAGGIVDGGITLASKFTFPIADGFAASDTIGAVTATDTWGLEEAGAVAGTQTGAASSVSKDAIPEIDIKVDSVAVTAITKKLKAKWSPELGQDLNAYHNLDAEVELTSILSEQIALEIDREILNDLVQGAKAGTYYWSRSPGLFVNRTTGVEVGATAAAPDFTGTVSEWYETLIETINDVSAAIHRKTLRGGANFLVCGPEVANVLEFTAGFRASVTGDADTGVVGAVKTGAISKKFDVYVDPYFPRNVVLVGRKGGSFLESGYVYAPYVPLQVTPTIFGTEDFVPRKGVMTRYAKKMVRPDMYGLVIVRGLLGESGSS